MGGDESKLHLVDGRGFVSSTILNLTYAFDVFTADVHVMHVYRSVGKHKRENR